MLTLVQILPYIIGPRIPENDQYWMNYLRLLQIVLLCTSSYCSTETSELLRILISLYLEEFKKLYTEASFIPKMHYMLHFPKQMKLYGPTRHHWCMRYEGKHGFFKKKKYRNFRNVAFSMAKDHQLHMCYKQAGPWGERAVSFLYAGDSVGQGRTIALKEVYPEVHDRMCTLVQTFVDDVYITSTASIHGLHYKQGCALVASYSDFTPSFVVLKDVIVYNHEKFFIMESTDSTYNPHIASYMLEPTGEIAIASYLSLHFRWPLNVYNYEGGSAVMNCHTHCCEIY